MADQRVGPIEPSAHDSATDQGRPTDFTLLSDTAPADIPKPAKGGRRKLDPLEKQALTRLTAATVQGAALAGAEGHDLEATAEMAYASGLEHLEDVTDRSISSLRGDDTTWQLDKSLDAYLEGQHKLEDLRDGANPLVQLGAGLMEFTLVADTWRALTRDDFEADPNFDYMKDRLVNEFGLPAEDREYLRESVSAEDMAYRKNRIEERQFALRTIGAHGAERGMIVSLGAGVMDPAGWAAGFGVGKVMQLSGVGARVAMQEGNVGRALTYGAMEGVGGNVLYTAALDAAGGHVTDADYLYAGAFGAGFGMALGVGAKRAARTPADDIADDAAGAAQRQAELIQQQAIDENFAVYREAQEAAGEGATPEQIATVADELARTRAQRAREVQLAPVDDADRLFPVFDVNDIDPDTGVVRSIADAVDLDPAAKQAIQDRWGLNEALVPDGAERNMLIAGAKQVDAWVAANPFDEARLNTILKHFPALAAIGGKMARSGNNALKYAAGLLSESSTGATGGKRTAAIDKALLERQYLEPLIELEDAYKHWRANGESSTVAAARDLFTDATRRRFNKAVDTEIRARENDGILTTDPQIKRAVDALETGYGRQLRDQIDMGTMGSARLSGLSARGYAPRLFSANWVINATSEQHTALSNVIAKQLERQWAEFEGGVQFARQTAARYLDRGLLKAYGSVGVPANLHSTEGMAALRDALRASAVPDDQIDKLLGKFSRGGASHTRKRLDLDLSGRVELPNGQSFDIADAFVQDHAYLYTNYSRRTSGEVALTKYGVMGEAGLKHLERLAMFGPKKATPEELEAFRQMAAEFMGKAVGDRPRGARYLDLLRMITASSRLGGMGITQFGDSGNMVGHLGVASAMQAIKDLPKAIMDIRAGRPSPMLESIELVGGPLGQDHRVIFPYQEAGDIRVAGQESIGALDRIVRAGSNAVPWLSGYHHMHSAQVRVVSEQIVHKAFRFIRTGENDVALKGMGFSDDLMKRIKRELPRIAKFDKDGRLEALDITLAHDAKAMAAFVQNVHRGGRQIIQGTFIGETGAWAHHDLLRILTQFRSFSLISMEKQWVRQRVDHGTAKAFGLMLGTMSFALPLHFARVHMNAMGRDDREEYLERQLSWDMLVRATMNYSALTGVSGDIFDAGAAMAGYEMSGVRGGGSAFTDNVPALGYINSTAKAIKEKDLRDGIRAAPGGNIPWLMPLFNQAD